MMTKEKSILKKSLKYFYILPVAVVTMSAFASPKISIQQVDDFHTVNDSVEIVVVKDTIAIKGTIVTKHGTPIHGALVNVKDTDLCAISDKKGCFELKAPADTKLKISHVGMADREVKVKKKLRVVLYNE